MNTLLWMVVIVLCLVVQGTAFHFVYRRKFAAHHAARLKLQQTLNGKLEQTKRQIGQLQSDLKTARQQLKLLGRNEAELVWDDSEARQALERELDDATSLRSSLPLHGFADTQPTPQETQNGSLLLR